jgi:hypothetical protein
LGEAEGVERGWYVAGTTWRMLAKVLEERFSDSTRVLIDVPGSSHRIFSLIDVERGIWI